MLLLHLVHPETQQKTTVSKFGLGSLFRTSQTHCLRSWHVSWTLTFLFIKDTSTTLRGSNPIPTLIFLSEPELSLNSLNDQAASLIRTENASLLSSMTPVSTQVLLLFFLKFFRFPQNQKFSFPSGVSYLPHKTQEVILFPQMVPRLWITQSHKCPLHCFSCPDFVLT